MSAPPPEEEGVVYITPLLKRLWPPSHDDQVTAAEIANAISHIFTNSLTPVQTGALLTALHFTGLDTKAEVLSKCSQAMRNASAQIDKKAIRDIIKRRGRKEGSYRGGLVSFLDFHDSLHCFSPLLSSSPDMADFLCDGIV